MDRRRHVDRARTADDAHRRLEHFIDRDVGHAAVVSERTLALIARLAGQLAADDARRAGNDTDLAEGVYDGLTLGAEATSAAEGVEGQLRYDPMSNRPFMAYGEGDYAAHYLKIVGAAKDLPLFAHVNWFQRDPEDGHYLWPGYRDNLRPLLWLLQLKNGEVTGRQTPVGIIPTAEELNLEGVDITAEDLETILTIDNDRWIQEMGFREEHLKQFDNLPEEIWEAHRRVADALEQER